MELSPRAIRTIVLQQSRRAGVGHIGSSLSIVELVCAVFRAGNSVGTDAPDRDRLVLSKGHAVLALYAALYLCERISLADLESFAGDDTALGMHPEAVVPGIDFSTGSLGHGLSYGAGAALAARMQGSSRRAFVILSDAELNEGSIWEGVMFAAHHRLSNLVAIVDVNGQQAFGKTKDVMNLEPLVSRWQAFGWHVVSCDGHDLEALVVATHTTDRPTVILAQTTFGKGVSFMENQIKWHYWPLNEHEFSLALSEVER